MTDIEKILTEFAIMNVRGWNEKEDALHFVYVFFLIVFVEGTIAWPCMWEGLAACNILPGGVGVIRPATKHDFLTTTNKTASSGDIIFQNVRMWTSPLLHSR